MQAETIQELLDENQSLRDELKLLHEDVVANALSQTSVISVCSTWRSWAIDLLGKDSDRMSNPELLDEIKKRLSRQVSLGDLLTLVEELRADNGGLGDLLWRKDVVTGMIRLFTKE